MLRELRREKLQAFFHASAGFRRQTENLYSGPHRLHGCPCGIPIELHRIRKFGLGDERNDIRHFLRDRGMELCRRATVARAPSIIPS